MAKESSEETQQTKLSNEEMKFLIKALWASLQSPLWTKDSLVDFGKAIFSKKTLKEMEDAVFEKVYPYLKKIAIELGARLAAAGTEMTAKAAETPAPETTEEAPEVEGKEASKDDTRDE